MPDPAHSGPAPALGRVDWWVLCGLIGFITVFYFGSQPTGAGYQNDSVFYLEGAKSLAQGKGYLMVDAVGSPRISLYPPGQSLILSLVWRWNPDFPANVPLLNAAMIALNTIALALVFVFLRRSGAPLWFCALFVCAWALSPNWYGWVFLMMSDMAFAAVCLALLLVWLVKPKRVPVGSARLWLATGALLGMAYLLRTAAVAPISVLLILLGLKTRAWGWRPLVSFMVPTALCVGVWRSVAGDGPGYSTAFRLVVAELGGGAGWIRLAGDNLVACLAGQPFLDTLLPALVRLPWTPGVMRLGLSPVVSLAAGALFWTVLACAGRGLLAQKSEAGFHTTCLWITLAYLALILVMPFEAALFSRYFFILLPLLAVWVWRGGSVAAVRPRTSAWMRTSVAVGLCGACLTNAYLTVLSKHGLQQLGAVAQLEDICRRIDDHLPREAKIAVASGLPLCHVHAYTGRSLVDAYPVRKGDATALARHPAGPPEADYLLVDSGTAGESARLRGLQTVLRSSGRDLSAGETGAPA